MWENQSGYFDLIVHRSSAQMTQLSPSNKRAASSSLRRCILNQAVITPWVMSTPA